MGIKNPASGKKRIRNREQTAQALELRKAGATLQAIGDQLKVSRQRAHQIISAALQELNATCGQEAEELRRLELERLDALYLALWQQRKNPRAVDTLLRIQERRAKLSGLDAPQKFAPVTPEGESLPPASPIQGLPTDLLDQLREHLKAAAKA